MADAPPPKPRRGSTVEMVDRIREQNRERTFIRFDEDGKPLYVDTTHF